MSVSLPSAPQGDQATPDQDHFDLVSMLLEEQQSLTAVEQFSQAHDGLTTAEPAQARYYQSLLPATPPGPGQQYGFHVDLDACSGCKACVVACHTMNGLEEDESWRRVGTVTVGGSPSRVQHVTTACHHCEDPGCLNGCPVAAYDKDPETGIVRHLDDQCIGCKYCTMMCPYEVPRYSGRLGIVRKCDMCHQRLSTGEAPACVQSCPNEAISIRVVETESTCSEANDRLAPGAPLSRITRPTTVYSINSTGNGHNAFSRGRPQDDEVDQVAESHWPLAVMLVATQISVGILLAERLAATLHWADGNEMPIQATRACGLISLIIAGIGMSLAPLHLGQPTRAWRVFLGLRTSWLSREAVVLGKYVGVLVLAVALLWLPVYAHYLPQWISRWIPSWAAKAVLGVSIVLGVTGLYSSAMIYIVTQRKLWRHQRTLTRFFGTAATAGTAWAVVGLCAGQAPAAVTTLVLLVSTILAILKLDWEFRIHLGRARSADDEHDRRSRRLVSGQLPGVRRLRLFSGTAAIALLVASLVAVMSLPLQVALPITVLAATTLTVCELAERWLYFSSVVYDRMPGTMQ